MIEHIDRIDLFPTPVWRYRFADFDKHREHLLEYFTQDEIYFTERERNGLQITETKLFDVEELAPLRDFMIGCLEDVMDKMGYEPKVGLTSMWANRYRKDGFIHEHIHQNCFLACVFYLYQHGEATGTHFHNTNANMYQIEPRRQKDKAPFFTSGSTLPFIEGTCAVFPAWAVHSTLPSSSNYRIIIGMNAMPVGRTNSSHYEQYDYPDPQSFGILDLEDDIKKNGYLKG